jgi:hypothetical protein
MEYAGIKIHFRVVAQYIAPVARTQHKRVHEPLWSK